MNYFRREHGRKTSYRPTQGAGKRRFVIMVENKNTEIGKSLDQKPKPQITKLENYKVEDRNQRLDDVLKSLAE